jgi:hypothetical protein
VRDTYMNFLQEQLSDENVGSITNSVGLTD